MPLFFTPEQLRDIAKGDDPRSQVLVAAVRDSVQAFAESISPVGSPTMGDASKVIVALADALDANGRP